VRADENVFDAMSDVRFKEGVSFYEAGKWEQCRASFLQMLGLAPGDAQVLLNLMICEQNGGHYVEALGHLKEYLASPKKDPKAAQELKGVTYVELWKTTGHLKISADRGEVIAIDDEVKGKAPLETIDVKPGSHRVTASGRTIDITVAAGETKDVNLASPAPVQPAVMPPPKEAKESYWTGQHIAGVTAGGLAVVAAGLGVGFWAAHQSHVSDGKTYAEDANVCLQTTSDDCSQFHKARDSAKTTATVSTVSFVAAGALAVGAVVLLWPTPKKEGSRVTARVIPTCQGVLIDGAF